MGMSCMSKFRGDDLFLQHKDPSIFVRSQWPIPFRVYLSWRLFWCLWHIAWISYSFWYVTEQAPDKGAAIKWFIYLSNLDYLILTVQSAVHAGLVIYGYTVKGQIPDTGYIRCYWKTLWVLTSVSFDAAILTTVLYWTLVFDGELKTILIATHGANVVYVITDTFVVAAPVRFFHFIYVMMYGAAYNVFTIIYHLLGGTNIKSEPYIYKSMDWSKPQPTALSSMMSFLSLSVVHLFRFGLYILRLRLYKACYNRVDMDGDNADQKQELEDAPAQTIVQAEPTEHQMANEHEL